MLELPPMRFPPNHGNRWLSGDRDANRSGATRLPFVKVLISGQPGTYTRFHRDDDCPGVRMAEDTHDAVYRQVELDNLPTDVKPCGFPCCFPGKESVAEVKDMYAPRILETSGIRSGQWVTFRPLGTDKTARKKIVHVAPVSERDEISAGSPYAKAMLGHEAGHVVDVELPNKTIQIEIVATE